MSTDYSTTAKALAVPLSPITVVPEEELSRPPWTRRRISSATRRTTNSSTESYKDQIFRSAAKVQRQVFRTFGGLTIIQKILAVLAVILVGTAGVLFLIYNESIFGWLAPKAAQFQQVTAGWVILWVIIFVCAFPPVIGYSTALTICGFIYGFPNGWFVASTASVVGSLASFIASRTVLSAYVHNLVGKDKRFQALALTLKHDGLKILCMIRLCPLPYSLSNGALSTFPTIHPLSFALATAIVTPKLFVHVFIGDRLRSIADANGEMDAWTRVVNYGSIALGSILGATVGYIIFSRTMARARELEIEELEAGTGGGRGDATFEDPGLDDAAALMVDPDDISLWENEDREAGYRDEFTDDDEPDVVFESGDGESEPLNGKKKAGGSTSV